MANFPNDGVGYNVHAEIMAKRASKWSEAEIAANAAMGNNIADLVSIMAQEEAEHAAAVAGLNNNLCSDL